jgi:hypothetical protein
VQEDDNSIPAFKIFGSQTSFVHWSYRRYLERGLREKFGYEGSAIQLWFIEKHVGHRHGDSPTQSARKSDLQKFIADKKVRAGKKAPTPKPERKTY